MERAQLRIRPVVERDARGRILPGYGGRQHGSKAKVTRVLKEAIIEAAAAYGENGRGRGDLPGFLRMVIRKDLRSFVLLLAKLMPLQLHSTTEEPREFRTSEEVAQELEARGIGSGMLEILSERMREREQNGNASLNSGSDKLN